MANAKGGSTVETVERIVRPVAEGMGLALWDIRFEKEGSSRYLRILIDKPGGVTIDDCEALSRAVDGPIDEADPIPESYYLEVSSPGVERELSRPEHFPPFVGQTVRVRLIRAREDGRREFVGKLTGFEDGNVSIEDEEGNALTFEKKRTAFVRLYVDFESGGIF